MRGANRRLRMEGDASKADLEAIERIKARFLKKDKEDKESKGTRVFESPKAGKGGKKAAKDDGTVGRIEPTVIVVDSTAPLSLSLSLSLSMSL